MLTDFEILSGFQVGRALPRPRPVPGPSPTHPLQEKGCRIESIVLVDHKYLPTAPLPGGARYPVSGAMAPLRAMAALYDRWARTHEPTTTGAC